MTPRGATGAGAPEISEAFAGHTWTDAGLADGTATITWDGHLWVGTAPGNVAFRLGSPGPVALEVDGNQLGAAASGDLDLPQVRLAFGEHTVRVVAGATHAGDTSLRISIDGHVTDAADTLYTLRVSSTEASTLFSPREDQ